MRENSGKIPEKSGKILDISNAIQRMERHQPDVSVVSGRDIVENGDVPLNGASAL